MRLFSNNKGILSKVNGEPFKLERNIQELIEKNTNEIFNLEFISSEFSIGNYRIDSLCFDNENKSFVIIEYKKGSSYSVIDQGYSYLSTMLNNKSDFILEYNEKTKNTLKRDSVNWTQSKIIFISPSFNSYQKNSVNFKDIPFELWEVKKYSNKTVSLNPIISNSKESIENISNTGNSIIKTVNDEVKVITIDDLIINSIQEVKDIWEKVQLQITGTDFDETRFNFNKSYMRFSRLDNSVISYFGFRKNSLRVTIIGGTVYDSGKRTSKNYFELDDYKKMSKKMIKKYKDGITTQVEYKINIDNEKDVDYVVSLLKQKYNSMS
jgi:hypothetical protein